MALLLIEGFDHMSTAYTLKGWSAAPSSTQTGRLGGLCCRFYNNNIGTTKILPATYTTIIAGVAFRVVGSTVVANALVLMSGATDSVRLYMSLTGGIVTLQVLNSAGTVLATGPQLTLNVWYYLEVKAVISATVGAITLKVNGVQVANVTNVNTGALAIDRVKVMNTNSGGNTFDFDDLYVLDTTGSAPTNDFLGDSRVDTLYPTAAGATTGWTPNAGANWDRSDEVTPDGDTTYSSTSTATTKDTYTMSNLASSTGTVYGVQPSLYARKDDAGSRTIATVTRLSATEVDGPTVSVLDTYSHLGMRIDEAKPGGGVWTVADVNSAEFGMKLIS